jgi:hypothetical protein
VVQAVAVGAKLGREPIHQMIRICAGETTLGHVMMCVLLIALMELCFMGYMKKDKTQSPPSQGDSCP